LDWHDLRYVLTVARERALAPAACALRINETTISRRIARLELAIGTPLFHRTRGMLLPTEVGQIVIRHAEHIESETETLGQLATEVDSRGAGPPFLIANDSEIILRAVCEGLGKSLLPVHRCGS
jgi:DNA-binding transcriptional LysR family regulator